jgi:hypothetical protein
MNGRSMIDDPTVIERNSAVQERTRLVRDSIRLCLTSWPALTLCAISSIGVVAALRCELFPGSFLVRRFPFWFGAPVSVAAWITMNLVVMWFYSLILQTTSRRIVSRICLAFALLVVAGTLSRLVLPEGFVHTPYWKTIYVWCCLIVFLRLLLPQETRSLWRHHRLNALRHWLSMVVLMTFLVLAGQCGFEISCFGSWSACLPLVVLALNVLCLASLVGLFCTLTNRFAFSTLTVSVLFALFVAASAVKGRYMQASIQPLDFLYLPEFVMIWDWFFQPLFTVGFGFIVLAVAAGLAYLWRDRRFSMTSMARAGVGLVAVTTIFGIAGCLSWVPAKPILERLKIFENDWDSMDASLYKGLALEFVSELSFVRVEQPAGYCESEVARCIREELPGGRAAHVPATQPADQVNLIVYLVESLMEPRDLGVDFSSDPIPSLRSAMTSHSSGYAVVPGTFGHSANSEFELLTGMAVHFLPEGCCPFKQYVKRDLPSLPRFLKRHGYRTAAIYTDPPSVYNRIQVYKHLGFDDAKWLTEEVDIPLDPRRRCPSDEAVVDTIIALSNEANPFFVFAFPNSTHSPYHDDVYSRSDLDVTTVLSPPAHRELKTYINTLRTADRAIGRLFAHFAQSKQKTIIVIAGDHQPPLAHRDALPSVAGFDPAHPRETEWHRRKVPLVVWTNWGDAKEDLLCSLNFLPTFLLSRMEITPQGFLAMNDSVRTHLGVPSRHVQSHHGRDVPADVLSAGNSQEVLKYRLLQYDLLLGNAYAGEWLTEHD